MTNSPNYKMMSEIAAEAAQSLAQKYNLSKFDVVDQYLDYMAEYDKHSSERPLESRAHDFASAWEQLVGPFVMQSVESSNIDKIGYDYRQLTLYVKFKGRDTIYEFYGVDSDVFLEFAEADSPGRFFAHRVKDAYSFAVIDE